MIDRDQLIVLRERGRVAVKNQGPNAAIRVSGRVLMEICAELLYLREFELKEVIDG